MRCEPKVPTASWFLVYTDSHVTELALKKRPNKHRMEYNTAVSGVTGTYMGESLSSK